MKMSIKNGLLVGLLLGAASAFLYAPKAGKELREDLKEKMDLVPQRFLNLLESFVDLTISVLDFAKDAFHEQGSRLSRAVSSSLVAAKEREEELRKIAKVTTR